MQGGECVALTQIAQAAQASPARFAHARATGFPEMGEARCPRIFQEVPELPGFLLDHAALMTGEVRAPGLYPMLENTPMADALSVAGGVTALGNASAPDVAHAVANPALTGHVTRVSMGGGAKLVSPRQALRVRHDGLHDGGGRDAAKWPHHVPVGRGGVAAKMTWRVLRERQGGVKRV